MAFKCDICGKGPLFGHNVSHSNKKTNRVWKPNLHQIRIINTQGSIKKAKVCSKCLKSDKVRKVV